MRRIEGRHSTLAFVQLALGALLAIGAAILQDDRPRPVFPRWGGYLSIWCALLFAPGGVIVLFKHGPFGWNGLLTWWLGLTAFGIWLAAITVLLLRAIAQQRDEAPAVDLTTARLDALSAEVVALREELARATAAT